MRAQRLSDGASRSVRVGVMTMVMLTACSEEPADFTAEPRDAAVAIEPRASSPNPADTLHQRLLGLCEDLPFLLSEIGVYDDPALQRISRAANEFAPAFPLWTDGAVKRRWLLLPTGSSIATRDASHWKLPVGSVAIKEFTMDGRRLETRLIVRTGPGMDDYWMGSFVWNDDESDAQFQPEGARDVRGTQHDVPGVRSCETCHRGDPARFLGLSEVQRTDLPTRLLSHPPQRQFVVPGGPIQAAALGYLHGNCAHCHNPNGSARPDTDLDLRLLPTDVEPSHTLIYSSTLGVPLQYFGAPAGAMRVVPGAPRESAVLLRMLERGALTQMPAIGTERIDPAGVAAVEAWIRAL